MTLSELKAQAARVFVEECAKYETKSIAPKIAVFLEGKEVFFGLEDDCVLFAVQRSLEARDAWLAENAYDCPELSQIAAAPCCQSSIDRAFAALGKREG
jgi:hypothetical protein